MLATIVAFLAFFDVKKANRSNQAFEALRRRDRRRTRALIPARLRDDQCEKRSIRLVNELSVQEKRLLFSLYSVVTKHYLFTRLVTKYSGEYS